MSVSKKVFAVVVESYSSNTMQRGRIAALRGVDVIGRLGGGPKKGEDVHAIFYCVSVWSGIVTKWFSQLPMASDLAVAYVA